MRAAVIFGLGTSPKILDAFRADSATQWIEGVPASSADADAVLIFGGDGTIHRHLPALVRLRLPVLIVPAGSGNDFARALNLRSMRDSVRAWYSFTKGNADAIQAVDVGTITPAGTDRVHYFCCVAGCGIDAVTARRANRMPRWLRAHGGYALALLPAVARFPPFPMKLTYVNGEDRAESKKFTLLAAFANTRFYGGGMRVAPHADPTDGKLDICRVNAVNPFKLFCMFPTVYFGRHLGISDVDYLKADRVSVETESPFEIYADGEYVCETPVEIRAARGALKVITLGPTIRK